MLLVQASPATPWGISMFTRNSSVRPKPLDPRQTPSTSTDSAITAPSTGEKSVIGNDLKIVGQGLKIISRGILQVDAAMSTICRLRSRWEPSSRAAVVERGARETSLRLSMEEEEQFHLQALDGKALHRDNLLARAPPQQRGQRAAPIALMSQR
jgi:hypothetical protein